MTRWAEGPLCGFHLAIGDASCPDRIERFAIVTSHSRDAVPGIMHGTMVRCAASDGSAACGTPSAAGRGEPIAPHQGLPLILATLGDAVRAGTPLVALDGFWQLALLEHDLRRAGLPTVTTYADRPTRLIDPLVLDRALEQARRGRHSVHQLAAHYRVQRAGAQGDLVEDVQTTLDLVPTMLARHPTLAAMNLDQLHAFEQRAHVAWTVRFTRLLAYQSQSVATLGGSVTGAEGGPDSLENRRTQRPAAIGSRP